MAITRITERFCRTAVCAPGKSKVDYFDERLKGYYLQVAKSGKRTFFQRIRKDGRTITVRIGDAELVSVRDARARAKEIKAQSLLGQWQEPVKQVMMTFAFFVSEYYLPYIKARKRSWLTDVSLLNNRILEAFGDCPLADITRAQVQAFHSELRESGLKPSTCDRHLVLIRYIFNLAVEWEQLEATPAARIKLFREDNKCERYLNEEETRRLLRVLQTDSNRPVALALLFLLSTGARRGEALKARWCDIDVANRVWRIPAENSKSKKPRAIPLNSSALKVLQELGAPKSTEQSLFISDYNGRPLRCITHAWFRMREKAGLEDVRMHDLRHSFASYLVNSGRSLYEVQQILGHSDPSVTMRYAHLSSQALQGAADSAAIFIGDISFAPEGRELPH